MPDRSRSPSISTTGTPIRRSRSARTAPTTATPRPIGVLTPTTRSLARRSCRTSSAPRPTWSIGSPAAAAPAASRRWRRPARRRSRSSIPEEEMQVSILGEKLSVVRVDGVDTFSASGRPMAVISNVMVEDQGATPAASRAPSGRSPPGCSRQLVSGSRQRFPSRNRPIRHRRQRRDVIRPGVGEGALAMPWTWGEGAVRDVRFACEPSDRRPGSPPSR